MCARPRGARADRRRDTLPFGVKQLPAVIVSSLALHAFGLILLLVGQVAAHFRPRDEPIAFIGFYPRIILWIGTAIQAVAFFLVLTASLALQKQMGDFQVRLQRVGRG